jgi:hypothetical protein
MGSNEVDCIKFLAHNTKPEIDYMSSDSNPLTTLYKKKFTILKDIWLYPNSIM